MANSNTDVDVVADLLKAVIAVRPEDEFCNSLWLQYQQRGTLSKKQLEGLLGKASKFTEVSPGKLATLEAIIKRKAQVHRTEKPEAAAPVARDEKPLEEMNAILEKYPGHKRIVFLKSKWEKGEELTAAETDDISRLKKVLIK